MPVHNYYKILFLPKWYPNRKDKHNGIFIERHAKAISKHCKTAVLYIGSDTNLKSKFDSEIVQEDKLKVVRVYYRNSDAGKSILGKAIKLIRYFRAAYIGLKIIKKEFGKPNLIHVNVLTRPGIVALALYKLNQIPYIVTEHWSGYMPADGSYKGFFKKWATQLVVKHAKIVTTVSNALAQAMQAQHLKANYVSIPNSVSEITIPAAKSNSGIHAIMVGNLEDREKNISAVIRALSELRNTLPELTLTLVGEGVDKAKLESLSASLKLENRITFTGTLPHAKVLERISSASFLIVNSHFETFSVVAAEALSCGTPVLSTKCGGPEEFIDATRGKLIEENNPSALLEGLKWMCIHYATFDKIKMKVFADVQFSEEGIAAQFIRIYDPLITNWEAGNTREKIRIPFNWKVLDVGSGDHPNDRADVLLEREIEATEHRSGAVAVIPEGKKLVLGDATEMPFANKEFEYVIASHIAEHIDEPEKFCSELQRVAKRGYLETPDAFSEFIFNEPFHKWVVSNNNGVLTFTEKTKHRVFSERFYRFYYLNEKRTNHEAYYSNNIFVLTFVKLIRKSWKHLPRTYTRFHWENNFKYRVIRKSQHD